MPNITYLFKFHKFGKELKEVYISHTIRRFAIAMVCIFEPIYLYLYFNKSISKTLLFFASVGLLYSLTVPFGAKIMAKLGLKRSMLFSVPFIFLYYMCLWQIDLFFVMPFLAIVARWFYNIFYWPAYHTDIARFSKAQHRGEQMGAGAAIFNIASVLGPFLGGIIVFEFGFAILFVIVLFILFLSATPLFFSEEIHESYYDSYKETFKRIFSKEGWKKSLSFFAYGISTGIDIFIWPIFMFIISINYETMGLLTSGALLLSLLFAIYIGKAIDKTSRSKTLKIGSILTSIAWIFKTFVRTPIDAFLSHVIYSFAFTSASVPFRAIMYDQASNKETKLDSYIVFREACHNGGRAVLFLIIAAVFFFVSVDKIYFVFPLASIFALFFILLSKEVKQ